MPNYGDVRFLVVDDMMTMRKIVIQQLKALGATKIEEAADGALAWQLLEKEISSPTPFNFIVSDWNMPNLNGLELLKRCREHIVYGTIPFLLVTAESETTQIETATKSGIDGLLVKPFAATAFAQKLQLIYEKRFQAK